VRAVLYHPLVMADAANRITVELPPRLREQLAAMVKAGWFGSEAELVCEALRRYLESHQPELGDAWVNEDVEWGLHGSE
jgi:Arc/MetJ-type ribon-helix-helix transcriptional regulator